MRSVARKGKSATGFTVEAAPRIRPPPRRAPKRCRTPAQVRHKPKALGAVCARAFAAHALSCSVSGDRRPRLRLRPLERCKGAAAIPEGVRANACEGRRSDWRAHFQAARRTARSGLRARIREQGRGGADDGIRHGSCRRAKGEDGLRLTPKRSDDDARAV